MDGRVGFYGQGRELGVDDGRVGVWEWGKDGMKDGAWADFTTVFMVLYLNRGIEYKRV